MPVDRAAGGPEPIETVEWVDEDDRVVEVVTRARMRAENLRHRSVGIVVRSTDGRLLVHRRSDTKDVFPGWWDVCAGGVVGVGEPYETAAARELAEELGIVDVPLRALGRGRFDGEASREVSRLYEVIADGPFTFADGEVAEVRWVTAAELATLLERERFLPAGPVLVLPFVDGFSHLAC